MNGPPVATTLACDARGFGRRLSHTPLRDALRGRFTGRLDREWAIEQARLPSGCAGVVRDVVRRTRLSRLERAEVTRELAAHFRDALDAGKSEMDAIDGFGDPATAARLIRRAAKRKRPLAWKLWVRAWACLGLVLLAAAAWSGWRAAWYAWGEPTISRNYLAEMNAEILKTPESERAWPIYRETLIRLAEAGKPPMPGEDDNEPSLWDLPQDSPAWSKYEAYVARARPALDLLDAARDKPAMGYPLSATVDADLAAAVAVLSGSPLPPVPEPPQGFAGPKNNPPLIGILLPHLSEMRSLARVLCSIEAPLAVRDGDAARFELAVSNAIALGSHLGQSATIIEQLVGRAVLEIAHQALSRVLLRTPDVLSDGAIARLAHMLSACPSKGTLRLEELGAQDFIQRTFTDNGSGDGVMTHHGAQVIQGFQNQQPGFPVLPLSPVAAGRRVTTEEVRRFYIEAERYLRSDEPPERVREWDRRTDSDAYRARYPVISWLCPSVFGLKRTFDRSVMGRDAALIALAAETHRRRTGNYPVTIVALTPGLLPFVPVDLYDIGGHPLKYTVRNGQVLIYSVGENSVDDNGTFYSGPDRNVRSLDMQLWPARD